MPHDDDRGRRVYVEVARLSIVLLFTAAGFAVGPAADDLFARSDPDTTRLVTSVLGALVGYISGGMAGRGLVRQVDEAQRRLQRVDAPVLITTVLGATVGGFAGIVLLWPVLLLPGREFTVPVAMLVLVTLAYAGGRVGLARGGDLLRFVGVRGRLEVTSPSRGGGTKLVDTSALVDGRLIDVARAGFLEGTLVVPGFVLRELQGLADAGDRRRRRAGRRGLDAVSVLQDEALVAVEVTEDEVPGVQDVDARLVAICRERGAALITVDANLQRVAEVSGVRILNLHGLAEAVRPPALPGERLQVEIVKEGRERGQGVGYLPDGTMVVIEGASAHVGSRVDADVTSILQTRQGRMLFAALAGEASAGEAPAGETGGDGEGAGRSEGAGRGEGAA